MKHLYEISYGYDAYDKVFKCAVDSNGLRGIREAIKAYDFYIATELEKEEERERSLHTAYNSTYTGKLKEKKDAEAESDIKGYLANKRADFERVTRIRYRGEVFAPVMPDDSGTVRTGSTANNTRE